MRRKKEVLRSGLISLAICALLASCNQGFDNDESFTSGVSNSVLATPAIDANCFSTLTNSDGTESVKLTWPVVYGANGYSVNVSKVDDPTRPIKVIGDSIVDGCSVTFLKEEDTKYSVSVLALGGKDGNTDSEAAGQYVYSTYVPATLIPEGTDIAEYINNNLPNSSDEEQVFELKGGAEYTMNSLADFKMNKVTLRGDKNSRSIIKIGENGGFMIQAGFKMKYINVDCTAMTAEDGVIGLGKLENAADSARCASITTEALGYKALGANQDGYVIVDPVVIQDCNFKNVTKSFLYGNKKNWSLYDFRITGCIVQLNNAGSSTVINLYGASNGLIKNFTIRNSTFYNIQENSSAYFLRYSNASNAQPKKIFGDSDTSGSYVLEHNTFCRTMTGKDFANNVATVGTITFTCHYNIFEDVFRLSKFIHNNYVKNVKGNTICGITNTVDSTDKDKYATVEIQGFTDWSKELDLTATNGGVDFTPTGSVAIQNKSGDPRWYK
ncbi:MAG: DUF4957 domain-containing protein [Bacteroidaceae bacterium]|nr:DUF4957 domain-containing protein [Bacteroidaceae bacterium]